MGEWVEGEKAVRKANVVYGFVAWWRKKWVGGWMGGEVGGWDTYVMRRPSLERRSSVWSWKRNWTVLWSGEGGWVGG